MKTIRNDRCEAVFHVVVPKAVRARVCTCVRRHGTARVAAPPLASPTPAEPFGKDDIIGCYANVSPSGGVELSFSKNGRPLGVAFSLPKPVGALYPAVCLKNGECFVNFGGSGAAPFRFPPSDGFVGVDSPDAGDVVMRGAVPSGKGGCAGGPSGPVVIVLTPARDLAEQVRRARGR
jgi:hypothetical protein